MVWNQPLTSKQLEYHNSKENKGCGLQNKPEQTYDRDFIRNFHGGAHTGSILQWTPVQGSVRDYEASPNRHSQGLFKTPRDHCKSTVKNEPLDVGTQPQIIHLSEIIPL